MLSFDEARGRLLQGVSRLGPERVPLANALGRVLAEPVHAGAPVPPFDASAMDGYAVATAAFAADGPWSLPVEGESRTGRVAGPLAPGRAARIFTGALIPEGADAVVMQEQVAREGDRARFVERPRAGAHIRLAGEDLAEGQLALRAGVRLGPAQLSLCAMLDRAEVAVARRPVVAILSTGDELRAPGSPASWGTIPESNGAGLSALCLQAGAQAHVMPIVGDDEGATEEAIARALRTADVLVTVGGVSVGDHDVVRPALERAGVRLDFWKVAMKPGKPLAIGRREGAYVLGLPGNPASAMVTFSLFGVPLLRALQGDLSPLPGLERARLGRPLRRAPGRLEFLRAELTAGPGGERQVVPMKNQASGAMTSLAWCDALAVIPAEVEALEEGAWVEILRLSSL